MLVCQIRGARAGTRPRGDAPAAADHVYQAPDAKGDGGEDGKEDNDDDGDDVVFLHHGGWLCRCSLLIVSAYNKDAFCLSC